MAYKEDTSKEGIWDKDQYWDEDWDEDEDKDEDKNVDPESVPTIACLTGVHRCSSTLALLSENCP